MLKPCKSCGKERKPDDVYKGKPLLCRQCFRDYNAKQRHSAKGRETIRRLSKIRYQKFKKECNARAKLSYAISKGKVIKPKYCSACLNEVPLQGHHEDYDKPLKVIWLCYPCHKDTHGKLIDKSLLKENKT